MARRADAPALSAEAAARGWFLARIAAGLLITAMGLLAWSMVNFRMFLRDHLNTEPSWGPDVHLFSQHWVGVYVPVLIAAAVIVSVLGAVRAGGRFRLLTVIEATISMLALILALLIY